MGVAAPAGRQQPGDVRRPGIAIPTAATTQAGPSRRARMTSSRHTASRTSTLVCGASSSVAKPFQRQDLVGQAVEPAAVEPMCVGGWTSRVKARSAAASGDDGQDRADMAYLARRSAPHLTAVRDLYPRTPTQQPTIRRGSRAGPVGPDHRRRHPTANSTPRPAPSAWSPNSAAQRPDGCCWRDAPPTGSHEPGLSRREGNRTH